MAMESRKYFTPGITHSPITEHAIMDNFLTHNAGNVLLTEPHATAFADMNGDGLEDLVTRKKAMSHLLSYNDPDPFGAPALYVYKTVRNSDSSRRSRVRS